VPFDEQRAERAVRFIETYLCHTKGQFAGQPFVLRDWQRKHVQEIFGRVNDDGSRQIRQVYWEIPKKNGKSEIAAAIALTLLYTDREAGAEKPCAHRLLARRRSPCQW
jgi:phage terminase large subunit-like protein